MGGEYSEVAETSCGASVFAAGNTIYELSGYDLESRTLEVWDLSPDACGIEGVPSTADCYRYALTDCRCSPNPPKCKQACLVRRHTKYHLCYFARVTYCPPTAVAHE